MNSLDIAQGLRLLSQLTKSGMPIGRVMRVFPDLAPEAWKARAPTIWERTREGGRLSAAIEAAVPEMPAHLIALVRAGENGVGIGEALERSAREAERLHERRQALLQSLSYPLLLLASALACVGLILFVVLPRFERVFAELGQALPTGARLLLLIVERKNLGLAVLVVGAGLIISAAIAAKRDPILARAVDRQILALPIIGAIAHRHATARFCSVVGALLELRSPTATALSQASLTLGNAELFARSERARKDVIGGMRISRALLAHRVIWEPYIALVAIGEETSSLPPALSQVAVLASDDATRATARLIRLIEPTLVLGIAAFVGAIAFALLQTVYSVRPT